MTSPNCSGLGYPSNYSGTGSKSNPYQVENIYDLQCMKIDLNSSYELRSDIDALSTYNWGDGFEPVGGDGSYAVEDQFKETFDGNGYTINDLLIEGGSKNNIGFIGYLGVNGTIKNVKFSNATVLSDNNYQTGVVAGDSAGSIVNVGAGGYLSGGGNNVGGLFGYGDPTNQINSSYSNVEVDSESSDYVGSLLGNSKGEIYNSYALGDVRGNFKVGGLTGGVYDGVLNDTYSIGVVEGSDPKGLVGYQFIGSTIYESNYWDQESSEVSSSRLGENLSTSEMQGSNAESNMGGFDFENIWETVETSDSDVSEDGYPILQSLDREEQLKAQGVFQSETESGFLIEIQNLNNSIIEGDDVRVEALIENNGDSQSTIVEIDVPGLGSNSTSVSLNEGSSTTKTLTVPTVEGDEGQYTVNISSDIDFDTQTFNVSSLDPPINPLPESGSEPVGLNWDLSAENNYSVIETNLEFYILNDSGSDIPLGGNLSSSGQRINVSLEGQDIDPETEYEWYANSTYNGQSAQSEIWNFKTVERPQVVSVEPDNEIVNSNTILNVTVDGNSPINVTVGESTGIDFKTVKNVAPGDTVQIDTSEISDFGEGPNEYWNVSLQAYGTEWNNSDDFYNFTVTDLEGVNYSLQDISRGDNLNPGDFGSLEVYGENEIAFQVNSFPSGTSDMNFRLSIYNNSVQENVNIGRIDDGDIISVDISELGIIDENQEGYTAEAYYVEGANRLANSEFKSDKVEFSTHVSQLEFNSSNEDIEQFRVYFNASSNSSYRKVVSVPVDSENSGSNNIYRFGVANRGLDDDGSRDCYAIRSWHPLAGLSPYATTDSNCLGGVNP